MDSIFIPVILEEINDYNDHIKLCQMQKKKALIALFNDYEQFRNELLINWIAHTHPIGILYLCAKNMIQFERGLSTAYICMDCIHSHLLDCTRSTVEVVIEFGKDVITFTSDYDYIRILL